MNKIPQKKNASSMQVIKTLQMILQNDYTMAEIIDKLNEKETRPIFNNSVISKYINTCRHCGIIIHKIQSKYIITKLPFGLEYTEEEENLLNEIQIVVNQRLSQKSSDYCNSFFDKLNRFSNKKIEKIEQNTVKLPIELFERAIAKKRKVRLMFKNGKQMDCIPINVKEESGKMYFVVYDKKERVINFSQLSGVEVLGIKYIDTLKSDKSVIFKLKGALAKRYTPRQNEIITINNDETITVTNRNEPKECLFMRLLRYDDKCEIITPKVYREEFLNLINSTLKNYGE